MCISSFSDSLVFTCQKAKAISCPLTQTPLCQSWPNSLFTFSLLLSAERTSSDRSFFHTFTYPRIHKMARWSPLLPDKRKGKEWTFYRIWMAGNLWDHRRPHRQHPKETLEHQRVGEVRKAEWGAAFPPDETLCLVLVWGEAPRLCPQPRGQFPPAEWLGALEDQLDGGHEPQGHRGLLWHDGQLQVFPGGDSLQQCPVPGLQAGQSLRAGAGLGGPVPAEQQAVDVVDVYISNTQDECSSLQRAVLTCSVSTLLRMHLVGQICSGLPGLSGSCSTWLNHLWCVRRGWSCVFMLSKILFIRYSPRG